MYIAQVFFHFQCIISSSYSQEISKIKCASIFYVVQNEFEFQIFFSSVMFHVSQNSIHSPDEINMIYIGFIKKNSLPVFLLG